MTPRVRAAATLSVLGIAALAAASGPGCGAHSAYDVQRDNPLGPSFWIIPVPSDDDSLLARSFPLPPDQARTLEEQSTPNPCADKLQERREFEMANHFENAIDTRTSASGGALLGIYGFQAEASSSTHLMYKVDTTTKISRIDTPEYLACCKEKGCGWGYVATLVRGAGEYAAGTEASAEVKGNYTVVSAGAARSYQVSQKRSVKGYLAAILVAHDRGDGAQSCGDGKVWAKIECVPAGEPARQETLCRDGNPQATDPAWKDNQAMQDTFRTQRDDACKWLAIHGGPSSTPIASADPAASAAPSASMAPVTPAAPTTPATSATPTAATPAGFEPGDYVAIGTSWSGKMTMNADGTFTTSNGKNGVWIWELDKLTLRWADGKEELLDRQEGGSYANFTGFFKIHKAGK